MTRQISPDSEGILREWLATSEDPVTAGLRAGMIVLLDQKDRELAFINDEPTLSVPRTELRWHERNGAKAEGRAATIRRLRAELERLQALLQQVTLDGDSLTVSPVENDLLVALETEAQLADGDGRPLAASVVRQAKTELARLQSIFGKLPKTADGAVLFSQMSVWVWLDGEPTEVCIETIGNGIVEYTLLDEPLDEDGGGFLMIAEPAKCYSTREAAEAAREEGK